MQLVINIQELQTSNHLCLQGKTKTGYIMKQKVIRKGNWMAEGDQEEILRKIQKDKAALI